MFELWDLETGSVLVLPGSAQELDNQIRLLGKGLIDTKRSFCIISGQFKVMLWSPYQQDFTCLLRQPVSPRTLIVPSFMTP